METNNTISENPEDNNSKTEVKSTFLEFLDKVKQFLRVRLSIRNGTDFQGTIDEVKSNIVFTGPNIWILICSIFIASIGLNVNSTAVIIGAMLISPLMGPIIGIGLSAGTNDVKLLKRSFKNFGIMVAVSLAASFAYFYFTPLSEAQSELMARSKPTLLDVMVAVFGGIAGIVAGSRSEKASVIPGVAIATALMPPLCAAGFGLAKFDLEFFSGAFYLFLLNSVFIALSTLFVVRYLNFPIANYVNPIREKNVKRGIMIATTIIVIPSAFIFFGIIQESIFKGKAEGFITQYMDFESTKVVSKNITYSDTSSTIEVFLIGEIIAQKSIVKLESQLKEFGLEKTKLKISQAKDESSNIAGILGEKVRAGIIEDLYVKNEELIQSKEQQINFLEQQLLSYKINDIDHDDFKNELKAINEKIDHFSYAKMISDGFKSKPDTVFTFIIDWDNTLSGKDRVVMQDQLSKYLQARFKLKKIKIISED
jgi:uncharacterized hydrophobic protein (TIGR00271 family)